MNTKEINYLINKAAHDAGRDPNTITLLAVSKQQTTDNIAEAFANGITQFGESYLQEAEPKIKKLAHLEIAWHFIGPIQSNKSKKIATLFDWVHSVNRFSIAERLNQQRSVEKPPLNICLQINLIDEETKSGIDPKDAYALTTAIASLPNLKLRGLMTIPPPGLTEAESFQLFSQLKDMRDELNYQLRLNMDTLSMGMSDDFVPAIKAGSTIVRIGRALFGERTGKTL